MDLENRMVMYTDPEPNLICPNCEAELYEGDVIYNFGGDVYCEHCIDDYKKYV